MVSQRPEWNNPEPSVCQPSTSRSRSRLPSVQIKQEPGKNSSIKAEPEDGYLPAASINMNLQKNARGTINLTAQHPDIQSLLALGIDYFLGFYLLKCAYPDLNQRTTFYTDTLVRSARDLKLSALQARVQGDANFRTTLSTVVSHFFINLLALVDYHLSFWAVTVSGAVK